MPKKKPGKALKKKAQAQEKPACQHCCEHKKLTFEASFNRVKCKTCHKTWGENTPAITINPQPPYRERQPWPNQPYWIGTSDGTGPDFTPTVWCADNSTSTTFSFRSN